MSKDFGPAVVHKCDNCSNEEAWHLCRRSVWATLFFIPVFPYEYKRFLVCPVCGCMSEISGGELKELRPYAEAHAAFSKGEITESEHELRIQRLDAPRPGD